MKVLLLAAGSRGDVEPFVALGAALRRAGDEVILAAGESLGWLADAHDVPFRGVSSDFFAMIDDPAASRSLRVGAGSLKRLSALRASVSEMLDAYTGCAAGAEVIVAHPKAIAGAHLGEALDVPVLLSAPSPVVVPTREFPVPGAPAVLGATFNRLSYVALRAVVALFRREIVRWRRSLDLDDRWDPLSTRGSPVHVLYAFSRALVPVPADWEGRATVTGVWRLPEPETWSPPGDLAQFLREAPAVAIGFGSMPLRTPATVLRTVLDAVRAVGFRAVVVTGKAGWSGGDVPDWCRVVTSVPHSWLFERVDAVVHHGGAGTTHAALAAGRPALVVPVFGDQMFWGNRVHAVGAGPRPIRMSRLDRSRLADGLRDLVERSDYARSSRRLAMEMAAEPGVDAAVEMVHALRE